MVRLKIAYWEFDFEAVCPTLDHDLLSQALIHCIMTFIFISLLLPQCHADAVLLKSACNGF